VDTDENIASLLAHIHLATQISVCFQLLRKIKGLQYKTEPYLVRSLRLVDLKAPMVNRETKGNQEIRTYIVFDTHDVENGGKPQCHAYGGLVDS
jgi:hypothetical protein